MPRKFQLAGCTAALACAGLLLAQTAAKPAPKPAAPVAVPSNAPAIHPLPAGFRMPDNVTYHYKAEWRLFNAGVISLKIAHGTDGNQHVTGTADASGVVARLYHVHDVFESSFDPATFCSQQIHKHTEEGWRHRETTIRFDYARRKSIFDDFNMKTSERRHLENDIPSCVTDVLSGLVYNTSLPLAPGETYVFPINDGGKTSLLELHAEAREVIRTAAGTYNTIRVQPMTSLELLKNKGKVWIWYSDDAQRIPVQMRGRMGWGTLTLTLESIEKSPVKP